MCMENYSKTTLLLGVITAALLVFPLACVFAQTVTETQPMTFGSVVIPNDSGFYTVTHKNNCSGYNADPEFIYFWSDPQCATFLVAGYPPNTPLTVTITPTTLDPQGGGGPPNFTIINPFTFPKNNIMTGPDGSVTFQVGATLRTSAAGGGYPSDTYDGIYTVDVSP